MILQHDLTNNPPDKRSRNVIVLFFLVYATLFVAGCTTVNRYKGFSSEKPPVSVEYIYSTYARENFAPGKEPADYGSVKVNDNVVYLASEKGSLEALYRDNFQLKWRFSVKNGVPGQLLLNENNLYFGAGDGSVYSIDTEFGKKNWEYAVKTPVYGRPTVAAHKLYFLASDDTLYCLDAGAGKWIWHYRRSLSYPTTIRGNSTPVVEGGRVYVGFSDGYFAAINSEDGNLIWETKIHDGSKFTDVDASPVFDGGSIYIPSYDGSLYILNKQDGKTQWKVDVGGSKRIILEDKNLYIASSDGSVYSLDKETGKENWKFSVDMGVPTNVVVHGDYLAFGSSIQYFYIIKKQNGALTYRYSSGMRSGFSSDPIQDGQKLYIFSRFGNLYSFRWNTPGPNSK